MAAIADCAGKEPNVAVRGRALELSDTLTHLPVLFTLLDALLDTPRTEKGTL